MIPTPPPQRCRKRHPRVRGFTLLELIVVLLIAGIISFSAMVKLNSVGDVNAQGFADELASSLRFAQKAAVAQRRPVYVNIDAANNHVYVCLDAASPCATPLQQPAGGALDITGPGAVVLTANVTQFSFSGFGCPQTDTTTGCASVSSALQMVATSPTGAQFTVTVQADSGYVQRT